MSDDGMGAVVRCTCRVACAITSCNPGDEVRCSLLPANSPALTKTKTSSTSDIEGIPLDEIYPALQHAIQSHSRPLRLNALRLLDSHSNSKSGFVKIPAGPKEVIKRCLQGEEVSLDVQGVRERVLRIGRVAQVLRDGDEVGADVCARWLIG